MRPNHNASYLFIRTLCRCLLAMFVLFTSSAYAAGTFFFKSYSKKSDNLSGLDGAYAVTVSPDGKNLYGVGYQSDALVAFERNPQNGELTPIQTIKNGENNIQDMKSPYHMVLSPDGLHAYVAGYGDDALLSFAREADGKLSFLQSIKNGQGAGGLDGVENVAITADGKYVYTASFTDNAVSVFQRDAASGQLSFIHFAKDGIPTLAGASALSLSPDMKNLYVASFKSNALNVFAIDSASGKVSFLQSFENQKDNVEGLYGANAVCVSPDGKEVYVGGFNGKAIARFYRNPSSGHLSYQDHFEDKVLNGVKALDISPDGQQLYAVSRKSNALISFQLDAQGKLSLQSTHKEGLDGVSGLKGAYHLVVTADGKQVYVASYFSDAIAVFNRQ